MNKDILTLNQNFTAWSFENHSSSTQTEERKKEPTEESTRNEEGQSWSCRGFCQEGLYSPGCYIW